MSKFTLIREQRAQTAHILERREFSYVPSVCKTWKSFVLLVFSGEISTFVQSLKVVLGGNLAVELAQVRDVVFTRISAIEAPSIERTKKICARHGGILLKDNDLPGVLAALSAARECEAFGSIQRDAYAQTLQVFTPKPHAGAIRAVSGTRYQIVPTGPDSLQHIYALVTVLHAMGMLPVLEDGYVEVAHMDPILMDAHHFTERLRHEGWRLDSRTIPARINRALAVGVAQTTTTALRRAVY